MLGMLGSEQEAMRIISDSGRMQILELSLQHAARDCAVRALLTIETGFLEVSRKHNKKICIASGIMVESADVPDAVIVGFSSEIQQEIKVQDRLFFWGGFNTRTKARAVGKHFTKPAFRYGPGSRTIDPIEKFKFVSPDLRHAYLMPYLKMCMGVFEQLLDSGYICIEINSTYSPQRHEEHYFTFFNPKAYYSFIQFGYAPSILESDAKYLQTLEDASLL